MSTVKQKLDHLEAALRETNKDLKNIRDSEIPWREKIGLIITGALCAAVIYIIVMAVISMLV